MKNLSFVILAIASFVFYACGNKTQSTEVLQEIDRTDEVMAQCNRLVQKFEKSLNSEDYNQAKQSLGNLSFNCDYASCRDVEVVKEARSQKAKLDSARIRFSTLLEEYGKQVITPVLDIQDRLTKEGSTATPFYMNKYDLLYVNISAPEGADIRIYNADSHALLRNYGKVKEVNDSILIPNDAIYFVEVNADKPQYYSYVLTKKVNDVSNIGVNYAIRVDTIQADENAFRAIPALLIKAESVFEEPRKITLKSIGGSIFGGHSESVVALNVPDGTLDVAYQLRISTNRQDKQGDGNFCKELTARTSKVKIFGVTVREKEGVTTNLLRETLNHIIPPEREEDAFCSMYVINDDENAKLAQAGRTYSYNIDYSTVGTQSCNGRIRNQKNKPIYLCFKNDRFGTTVYIWLEAIATYPYMAYYQEKFTLN